jgi:hypothetical protein
MDAGDDARPESRCRDSDIRDSQFLFKLADTAIGLGPNAGDADYQCNDHPPDV